MDLGLVNVRSVLLAPANDLRQVGRYPRYYLGTGRTMVSACDGQ